MEIEIVKFLNAINLGPLDYFIEFVSGEAFLVILWTVITGYILFTNKANGKKITLTVILAVILHFSITEGLVKSLLSEYLFRLRPYLADPGINVIGKKYTDSSFFSGHMASTLAVLTVYFRYYRKYWPLMAFFILLIAFARMHNGAHYPSDVLAGTFFGILFGFAAIWLAEKFYKRFNN